jgi:hypothetical protein
MEVGMGGQELEKVVIIADCTAIVGLRDAWNLSARAMIEFAALSAIKRECPDPIS